MIVGEEKNSCLKAAHALFLDRQNEELRQAVELLGKPPAAGAGEVRPTPLCSCDPDLKAMFRQGLVDRSGATRRTRPIIQQHLGLNMERPAAALRLGSAALETAVWSVTWVGGNVVMSLGNKYL